MKLTKKDVLYIFSQRAQVNHHESNALTSRQLASKYGISERTVRDIWSRRSRRNLTQPAWTVEEVLSENKRKRMGRPPGAKDTAPRQRNRASGSEQETTSSDDGTARQSDTTGSSRTGNQSGGNRGNGSSGDSSTQQEHSSSASGQEGSSSGQEGSSSGSGQEGSSSGSGQENSSSNSGDSSPQLQNSAAPSVSEQNARKDQLNQAVLSLLNQDFKHCVSAQQSLNALPVPMHNQLVTTPQSTTQQPNFSQFSTSHQPNWQTSQDQAHQRAMQGGGMNLTNELPVQFSSSHHPNWQTNQDQSHPRAIPGGGVKLANELPVQLPSSHQPNWQTNQDQARQRAMPGVVNLTNELPIQFQQNYGSSQVHQATGHYGSSQVHQPAGPPHQSPGYQAHIQNAATTSPAYQPAVNMTLPRQDGGSYGRAPLQAHASEWAPAQAVASSRVGEAPAYGASPSAYGAAPLQRQATAPGLGQYAPAPDLGQYALQHPPRPLPAPPSSLHMQQHAPPPPMARDPYAAPPDLRGPSASALLSFGAQDGGFVRAPFEMGSAGAGPGPVSYNLNGAGLGPLPVEGAAGFHSSASSLPLAPLPASKAPLDPAPLQAPGGYAAGPGQGLQAAGASGLPVGLGPGQAGVYGQGGMLGAYVQPPQPPPQPAQAPPPPSPYQPAPSHAQPQPPQYVPHWQPHSAPMGGY